MPCRRGSSRRGARCCRRSPSRASASIAQVPLLVAVERTVVLDDVVVGGEQEAAGAAGGVADRHARARAHHIDDRPDQRARREVLAGAGLGVLPRSSPAAPRRRRPSRRRRASVQVSWSIRSTISRRSLAGSWIRFCALRKMTPSIPGFVARARPGGAGSATSSSSPSRASRVGQSSPSGDERLASNGGLRLLVGHLEEQQVGELLDVVAVGEPVVAQDVAVVPEALDEAVWTTHARPSRHRPSRLERYSAFHGRPDRESIGGAPSIRTGREIVARVFCSRVDQ